jgi:hypothetical protein
LEGGPPGFPQASSGPVVLGRRTAGRSATTTGLSPALARRSRRFVSLACPAAGKGCAGPQPHVVQSAAWFGLVPVRSPLLRESRLISLRRATKMFQFTRCPPPARAGGVPRAGGTGCPIRRLRDQRLPAAPPERFAARRVLPRPSAPRHPPHTLLRLLSPLDNIQVTARCYLYTQVLLYAGVAHIRLRVCHSLCNCSGSLASLPRYSNGSDGARAILT